MGNFALPVVHIVSSATWVALLFFHLRALAAAERSGARAVAQRRRMRQFTLPAALAALVTGAVLVARDALYFRHAGWLPLKLFAVAGLVAITLHARRAIHSLDGGQAVSAPRRYAALEEATALLVALILLLVALRPF